MADKSDRSKQEKNKERLTNRQGHPVTQNQNIRTVGNRGPGTLENYDYIEKISHFDRERVPERVVHGRGAGAHGYFEAYGKIGDEPASKYTRAKLFQEKGKRTPVFVRFFNRHPWYTFTGNITGPTRLCSEILHRRRKLGLSWK